MDYIETFRPVFVYALHLVHANPNQNRWLTDENAVKNDLASLLAATRASDTLTHDQNLETARYALHAWLREILQNIPNGNAIAQDLLPETDPVGSEFYHRLGKLLTPNSDGIIEQHNLDAIRIYNFCLEHEYRGYYARPGCEHQRQAYRRRCRQALEIALSPADLAPDPPPPPRTIKKFARAAMWILPIAATLLLYGLYRTVLKDLYLNVVG